MRLGTINKILGWFGLVLVVETPTESYSTEPTLLYIRTFSGFIRDQKAQLEAAEPPFIPYSCGYVETLPASEEIERGAMVEIHEGRIRNAQPPSAPDCLCPREGFGRSEEAREKSRDCPKCSGSGLVGYPDGPIRNCDRCSSG